jgi:adenylate cyclase
VARISAQELAELVPCSVENIARLEQLGLLAAGEDELFPSSDVHVARLMDAFETAGIALDDVARGVTSGELSFPLGLFMPEPVALSETYEELGARLSRAPELLRRLSAELGLPPPADGRVRSEDAEILTLLVTRLDLVDDDDLSRFARLYGGTMQRLVASGIQFFDRAVRGRVADAGFPNVERDRIVYEQGAGYAELVGNLVPWLQRRHRERTVLDYLVGVTEEFMEERGIIPSHPRQLPAIAFLDLTGYTEITEERGDEAAAEVASELAGIVQSAAQNHGGQAVKWLGDGVMFHFDDPAGAILSSLDLVETTEKAIAVPARIGINAGAVVAQEGDYFGRTVNIASRIADQAKPNEVLVSEEARLSAGSVAADFELVGDVPLKGISRSVRLHRATRARS